MLLAGKQYEMLDPVTIGRNSALAVVARPHERYEGFQKGRFGHGSRFILEVRRKAKFSRYSLFRFTRQAQPLLRGKDFPKPVQALATQDIATVALQSIPTINYYEVEDLINRLLARMARRSVMPNIIISRLVLYLLLMASLGVPAATTAQNEYFWMRCQAWSDPVFNNGDKQLYISGLRDGLLFAESSIQEVKIPSMTIDATVRAVNDLCNDPGNMMLPVPFIIKIVAMKVGGTKEETIQLELEGRRLQFSGSGDAR
jgi:hypothetical protein